MPIWYKTRVVFEFCQRIINELEGLTDSALTQDKPGISREYIVQQRHPKAWKQNPNLLV